MYSIIDALDIPPLITVSKIEQLYDLAVSLRIKLTKEKAKYFEEPYTPRDPIQT